MTVLRSLVFNVFFFAWLAFVLVVMLLFLPLPRRVMQNAVRVWTHVMGLGLKVIVGLDYEVRGRQHIPWGGVIFACKHQSAWETMAFHILFSDTSYVIKKELFAVPLFGWYARKCQSIPVDRAGGGAALRRLIRDARIQIAAGRALVIFPEGTRMAPGTRGAYHPGVFALYKQARAPGRRGPAPPSAGQWIRLYTVVKDGDRWAKSPRRQAMPTLGVGISKGKHKGNNA